MPPPNHFEELSNLLEKDKQAFLNRFLEIQSSQIRASLLLHDFYYLYLKAKSELEENIFELQLAPLLPNFSEIQFRDLLSSASSSHHPEFAKYFASIPMEERAVILMKGEPQLFEIIKRNFSTEQIGAVLMQLPDPLANPSQDPYINQFIQGQLAYKNHQLDELETVLKTKITGPASPESFFYLRNQLEQQLRQDKYEEFLQSFEAIPIDNRAEFLASDNSLLYKLAFSKLSIIELTKLFSHIPDDLSDSTDGTVLLLIELTANEYQKNKDKSELLMGLILMRAPSEICLMPKIATLSLCMKPNDFLKFLSKQEPAFFSKHYLIKEASFAEGQHPLYSLMLSQGVLAVSHVIALMRQHFSEKLSVELLKFRYRNQKKEYLYQLLLQYPGDHASPIIELVNPSLTDFDRSHVVLINDRAVNKLPKTLVESLLKMMSDRSRLQLLLTPVADSDQTLLIETIAKTDTSHFLEILAMFSTSTPRYLIYSQPVKYAVTKRFTQHTGSNAAAGAISSAVSWIPVLGSQAKQTLDSYQEQVDVSEFLLSRMLRTNPELKQCLVSMLGDLTSKQRTALLREPDANGHSLLIQLCYLQEREEIIEILKEAAFDVLDNQKLIDSTNLSLVHLRSIFSNHKNAHAVVGFLSLLGLYAYLCVRGLESRDAIYQNSRSEYINMLSCLFGNELNNGISAKLKTYCADHPLREAWSIPLASSSLKLGTNRHLDARNKLLELSIYELQHGTLWFKCFVLERVKIDSNLTQDSLDKAIVSLLPKETKHRNSSMT